MPTPLKGGTRGLYNDAGEVAFAHTGEALASLKKAGFRHAKSPKFLAWPKDAYNSKTGHSKQVSSQEALDALGPDWSLNYIEPKSESVGGKPVPAATGSSVDDGVVKGLKAQIKDVQKAFADQSGEVDKILEVCAAQDKTILAQEERLKVLEDLIFEKK